jgi:hypothetical protein
MNMKLIIIFTVNIFSKAVPYKKKLDVVDSKGTATSEGQPSLSPIRNCHQEHKSIKAETVPLSNTQYLIDPRRFAPCGHQTQYHYLTLNI